MKLGRRQLLGATLGTTQLALLEALAPRLAHAQPMGGPSRLLTLYLPGGWMSLFAVPGLSPAQVAALVPAPWVENGAPIFFRPDQVKNLDGSSDPGRLKTPALWNEAALRAGQPDPQAGGATSPNGWSWVQHRLWENALVVHGVDNMSAAHVSGTVSALTGVASSEYRAPSVQALAAAGLFGRFPDRLIPSVWIGGPEPALLGLRPDVAPARITSVGDVEFLLSNRRDRPWRDLRPTDVASPMAPVTFRQAPVGGGLVLNPIEARVSRRLRSYAGRVNAPSEATLEQLHDGLLGVSRILARDVVGRVQATRGVEFLGKPFWAPAAGGVFAVEAGGFASDDGSTWHAQFDLALRLLKADVATSVAVNCAGLRAYGFDNGHSQGHRVQFAQVRGTFEIIGRLLAEMKQTPVGPGRSLLDDTVVLVLSDFMRTFPNAGVNSDHWPSYDVIMAGGGLRPNQAIGGYAVDLARPNEQGYDGAPIAIREPNGTVTRRPRSGDVITTALAALGVTGISIAGGNGDVVGARS
ncbi:MAG: DUF1501 domain-containing protein [Myxococcaceae bacterium]|jgi:uncharacterized protein (DUF1501 family)|nr:DUF1501 domain-containing protein [Myxococcaceae bacterium]